MSSASPTGSFRKNFPRTVSKARTACEFVSSTIPHLNFHGIPRLYATLFVKKKKKESVLRHGKLGRARNYGAPLQLVCNIKLTCVISSEVPNENYTMHGETRPPTRLWTLPAIRALANFSFPGTKVRLDVC